jgi:mannopine transport system substrate-binding protein
MSDAGRVEWDVVLPNDTDLQVQKDLLEKLDCTRIPNAATQGVDGACAEYGLLRTTGGAALVYSKEAFPDDAPTTWADFWDVQRFPGPRAIPNAGSPWEYMALALLADGVSRDQLYPLDVDRALRKLDELRPNIGVFWTSGDQSQQVLRDREVVMSWMWTGRGISLQKDGTPVQLQWSTLISSASYWSILKGGPNQDEAYEFLDYFMTRPEAHIALARAINYTNSNKQAIESLPEFKELAETVAEAPTVASNPWVIENRDMLVERWNAWVGQ